ncbi:peptide deformylase [Candidatus Parcubacteria bacterium]|nr:peptide deformylase [Candidatus Parcubacteria bacterium]
MKSLSLVSKNDSVLHEPSREVPESIAPEIKQLIAEMQKTMRLREGVGLAAPQVGQALKIFVVDRELIEADLKKHSRWARWFTKQVPAVYINPEIVRRSGDVVLLEEGCLSVPGVFGLVPRWENVTLKAFNQNGRRFRVRAKGLFAHVLQHEMDHLEGHLFTEKVKKYTTRK